MASPVRSGSIVPSYISSASPLGKTEFSTADWSLAMNIIPTLQTDSTAQLRSPQGATSLLAGRDRCDLPMS